METNAPAHVAALFAHTDAARRCFEALLDQGFEKPWMATAKAADGPDIADAFATTAPSRHALDETSDGPLGGVARFFSGEGNSIRRALEDRGLTADAARRIDESLGGSGAVVVVNPDTRLALAVQIAERTGGRVEEAVAPEA